MNSRVKDALDAISTFVERIHKLTNGECHGITVARWTDDNDQPLYTWNLLDEGRAKQEIAETVKAIREDSNDKVREARSNHVS